MGILKGLIPGLDSEEQKPKSGSFFDDFFCTGSSSQKEESKSGGFFDDFFCTGSSGSSTGSQKEVNRQPLFGSGGIFDDQKKPANTQYNVLGHLCNNEQEVKDAINEESGYGNMGCYCPHCGLYHPNKASMLNCPCRKYR